MVCLFDYKTARMKEKLKQSFHGKDTGKQGINTTVTLKFEEN